ncbi:MAG: endonuclease III [Candidatus Heimdallarchaeota archaeon]|nr:endonuclease III [Candidatus Heimdallarchaeota archaeon]
MILLERTLRIFVLLEVHYPKFIGGLTNYTSPFQMLIATVLSTQSTDKQVNSITRDLFSRYPNPASFASATISDIEQAISKVGLYKNKAKFIQELSKQLISEFDSIVPTTIGELVKLPGVGRKTANVLLNDWFNIREGIAVDTHVKRLSYRLGLTSEIDPFKIEKDLLEIIPNEKWGMVTHLLISHGRAICKSHRPLCKTCFLMFMCPRTGVVEG